MTGPRGSSEHDVVLRLLDHQIVGPSGMLLGNVDDLELVGDEGGWFVTGLMVGPAALSQRLPGLLGHWVYAVWHRLHPAEDPAPVVIPIDHVTAIGSAVHVDLAAAQALSNTFGVEIWLRRHVISRLPGAIGDADDPRSETADRARRVGSRPESLPLPARAPLDGARGVSTVVGRTVVAPDGTRAGRVSEVRCLGARSNGRQERLRARWILYTPHLTGAKLGYSVDREQGPALVRRIVRTWQRHDRIVDAELVEGLNELEGDLTVRPEARPRHPHDS